MGEQFEVPEGCCYLPLLGPDVPSFWKDGVIFVWEDGGSLIFRSSSPMTVVMPPSPSDTAWIQSIVGAFKKDIEDTLNLEEIPFQMVQLGTQVPPEVN